jgi:hypothetical protein
MLLYHASTGSCVCSSSNEDIPILLSTGDNALFHYRSYSVLHLLTGGWTDPQTPATIDTAASLIASSCPGVMLIARLRIMRGQQQRFQQSDTI